MKQVLKLDDLSEGELSSIDADIEANGDESKYKIDKAAGEVVILDEVDMAVQGDPRAGVIEGAPAMTENVARILEEPFNQEAADEDGPSVNEQLMTAPAAEAKEIEDKPLEPDPPDVRNFLRSLLGNTPYTKSYAVFGGKVTFMFRARTHKQDEDCVFKSASLPPMEAMACLSTLRLAYSLVELRIGEKLYDLPGLNPGQLYKPPVAETADITDAAKAAAAASAVLAIDERSDYIGELQQSVVGLILSKLREFDLLLIALQQRADDPKFWETDTAD